MRKAMAITGLAATAVVGLAIYAEAKKSPGYSPILFLF